MEGGHLGQIEGQARVETDSKHEARIREISACSILEGCAEQRLDRLGRSQTRSALEHLDLNASDLVDIWFDPTNKNQSGWRGPAEVKTVNASEGNASVRIQGRTLDRQRNHVRHHVPYFIMCFLMRPSMQIHW